MDFNGFSLDGIYLFVLAVVSVVALIFFLGIRRSDKASEENQRKLSDAVRRENNNP